VPEAIASAGPLPEPAPTDGPTAIYSNTSYVEAIAAHGNQLWAATRGGLERYDMTRRTRDALYTTQDGLPSLMIEKVSFTDDFRPMAITAEHRCLLHVATNRFGCERRTPTPSVPSPEGGGRVEGSPITARYTASDGSEWLGTADLGLWVRDHGRLVRVSPTNQVVANHVVAIAEWRGTVYFASFDHGLGSLKDGKFTVLGLGPQMLNDVLATPEGLFVASSEGLYVTTDGATFQREQRVTERFVNDLAYDAKRSVLYATATSSLWELPLGKPKRSIRADYLPGGSHSLQAVDVAEDGAVYLASEDRGILRRDGRRKYTGFDRLAGYPSSWTTDVLANSRESAWAASLRHGVYEVGRRRQTSVAGVESWVLFLGRDPVDPRNAFIGTQDGAWVARGSRKDSLRGLPNLCVHSLARLSDGLWVGTEGGVAVYR
jgi:ligand-binding sensor domain-containing protein